MIARRVLSVAVTALLASGVPGVAPMGPDPWREEVIRALAAARGRLAGLGAKEIGATHLGVLSEGESAVITVTLREGAVYFVVAACDRDCGRLSLEVTDPRRYTIDVDRSNTARPALRIVPAVTGPHRVVVTLARCAVDPCRYGVELVAP